MIESGTSTILFVDSFVEGINPVMPLLSVHLM